MEVGGMADVETSHQYSFMFCCHVTGGSRGAVWRDNILHGSVYEAKVCHLTSARGKNCVHWHSSTLAEGLWRPNSGCEHSEAVGGVFQQWLQQQWVTSKCAEFYKRVMQAFTHCWWKFTGTGGNSRKIVVCSWEFALSSSVIVLFAPVVISIK